MAGSVNKVILVGNLGKDPEVRSFQNGGKVVNLTVATSESWNDKTSGERKERTEWHKVVIKNDRVAATAEKFLKKGAKVYIEGTLETRKWMDSQSGQEKYTTEVIVGPFRGEMTMLSGRGEEGGGGFESRDGEPRGGGYGGGGGARQQPSRGGGGGGGGGNPSWDTSKAGSDLDDEIPF